MRLPIDPQADSSRRAWVACPVCDDARHCATCASRRNCFEHWRYLISNKGPVAHLQCPRCTHMWSLNSRPGVTGRGNGAARS
ncbi:hypothetical protein ACIPW9_11605 [Streptomyces sp. NPDC090052]|uniref:hypothetical protein n=1 Tax=unclassified Streptomyces TaxID=2593676 RepID=UPI0022582315|nr:MULTISPECIES: hypothetical protein [unclassified Streptomyces]MCX4725803.1 hypothetical protein [Streptomyces sp. NBC_01306]WSV04841.1 hypothetical protein OG372_15320 [Streptomyces sp. NBC_01020]WSX42912.1 hypothetical protein OG760_15030 [Streptomyces sp. NBC_00963]WSX69077.1 hypothetical protein OG221_22095 [Streptomyces sp. NBC_00932]